MGNDEWQPHDRDKDDDGADAEQEVQLDFATRMSAIANGSLASAVLLFLQSNVPQHLERQRNQDQIGDNVEHGHGEEVARCLGTFRN